MVSKIRWRTWASKELWGDFEKPSGFASGSGVEKVSRGHMEEVRQTGRLLLCDLGLVGFPLCTLLVCTVKDKEHLQQVLGSLPNARCPCSQQSPLSV